MPKETLVFDQILSVGNRHFPKTITVLPGTIFTKWSSGIFSDYQGIVLDYKRIANTGNPSMDWLLNCNMQYRENEFYELELTTDDILFEHFASAIITPEILCPSSFSDNEPLLITLKEVNDEILEWLSYNPGKLDSIHPAAFEDLIYKIFANQGFDVEKIGRWNEADGGVDLMAIQKKVYGLDTRFAIQCKRSKNSIQPRVIRELNGVLDSHHAHFGIVAASSGFTKAAIEETKNEMWKISLLDKTQIIDRMRSLFR